MDLINGLKKTGKAGLMSLLLLTGCSDAKEVEEIRSMNVKEEVPKPYFMSSAGDNINHFELGDVNGDGYLDIIMSLDGMPDDYLQLYEGDGKGNFTLKKFYDKDIQRAK